MMMSFMPMPKVETPTQSDVAFAGNIGNSRLRATIAVPKQQVLEIVSVVTSIKQKMHEMRKERSGQGPSQLQGQKQ